MKRLFFILILIVCGAAIVAGNLHWNNKIAVKSEEMINNDPVVSTEKEEPQEEAKTVHISNYSKNLPEGLQEKMNSAITSGKPLQLVIYGSDATSNAEGAWPKLLSKQLRSTYGKDLFHITILSEGNQTTQDVVREKSYEEVSAIKPDIVLFEPFMLKDNSGLIGVPNTIKNIETMMKSWVAANKDVTILMQPPNPLYDSEFYPRQVNQLKEYAEENNIIYLNHWENWPDLEDEKLKSYLTDESQPSGSGNMVWAEFVTNYFIAR